MQKRIQQLLCGLVLYTLAQTQVAIAEDKSLDFISGNSSETEKYRVVWTSDPATTATIAWHQKTGAPAVVHFGTADHKRHHQAYDQKQSVSRVQDFHEMKNCFVRLANLIPDTDYFFVLKDDKGVSRRLQFRTAPNKPQPFTLVAGGDSRNNRDARQAGNSIIPKLKPLFVAFTGDMISTDRPSNWINWFDDWQLTIGKDGTITPIVPHRGNHEGKPESIHMLFDTQKDAYYSFSVGGNLLRYYALNSMVPAAGNQGAWLQKDLAANYNKHVHLVAGYHHPMRPHVAAKKEGKEPYKWSAAFYKYGVDLAIESDSHCIKRTRPLKPDANGDEGFSLALNDKNATVYIGEGCWGAPLRGANDAKSWTIDCDAFNGFDWIYVSPEKIQVKTVQFKASVKMGAVQHRNSFETPNDTLLWDAKGGVVLEVAAD